MDKGEIQLLIETLQQAQAITGTHQNDPENLKDYDLQILGEAYSTYKSKFKDWTGRDVDPRIVDVRTFHRYVGAETEIGALIVYLYKKLYQEDKELAQKDIKEQENTVPAELESMVAEYEKFKAEQKENDGSAHSVADAVKRAREAMVIRERLSAIRKNRAALSGDPDQYNVNEDKRYEDQITKICNPKAKDGAKLMEPIEGTLVEAVHSYIDQRTDITSEQRDKLSQLTPEIVKNAQYLYLTGALDISNHSDLIVGVEVALHLTSPQTNTPITLIYDELVKQEQEIDSIRRNISYEELKISDLQNQLSKAKSKDEMDRILVQITQVQSNINQLSGQIDSIPTRVDRIVLERSNQIESHLDSQVEGTINNNNVIKYEKNDQGIYIISKNADGSPVIDRDFTDNLTDKAGKTVTLIQEKLSTSGIEGKLPPTPDLMNGVSRIETAIRKDIPGVGISLNATYEASQAAVLLDNTKAQNSDLSAQAVLMFGKGMTTKKLDEVIEHAKNNPTSDIGKLLRANPDLFGRLRHQLSDIEATNSEEANAQRATQHAKDNPNSALGRMYSKTEANFNKYIDEYTKLSQKLSPKQIVEYAKNNPGSAVGKMYQTNKDLFTKASNEINKLKNSSLAKEIQKPINAVNKFTTNVQNRVFTVVNKFSTKLVPYANFIMDPFGSVRSYLGRKAGEYILKKVASVLSKEAGEFLLKNGLKGTVKELAKLAAKRIAAEAAKLAAKTGIKVSLQAAAQAANAIPGLGLVIAVAIEVFWAIGEWTIGALKKGLDKLSMMLYGEEYDPKKAIRDAATGIFGIGTMATYIAIGIGTAIINSLAAAAVTAMATLGGVAFAVYFIYVSALVVGPLISTLAQLESQPSSPSQQCNGTAAKNDKANCSGSYCFPVNDISTVSYVTAHHDYPANDIMRIGDKPGPADDVPLPLLAYTSGNIIWISENDGKAGFGFILAGNDGRFYLYSHNVQNLVTLGQSVMPGDVVACMGSSGNAASTYEHLHFQISDQADMVTIPENYPHFFPPWVDFCDKLSMCGPLNVGQYPEFQ